MTTRGSISVSERPSKSSGSAFAGRAESGRASVRSARIGKSSCTRAKAPTNRAALRQPRGHCTLTARFTPESAHGLAGSEALRNQFEVSIPSLQGLLRSVRFLMNTGKDLIRSPVLRIEPYSFVQQRHSPAGIAGLPLRCRDRPVPAGNVRRCTQRVLQELGGQFLDARLGRGSLGEQDAAQSLEAVRIEPP